MDHTKAQKLSREESSLIAETTGKPLIPLILTFLFSLIQIIRFGIVGDYGFLLIGSILSICLIGVYSSLFGKTEKSWLSAIIAFGGFIPYLFGCYLFFYRGMWRLADLVEGFAFLTVVKAVCFIVLGYVVVSGLYRLTEIVRMSKEGRLT
jgi:hypothetical protein